MCGLVLNIFKMWQVDCQNIFSKTFQILICILEREQKWRDDWCHVAYTGTAWRWRGSRRRNTDTGDDGDGHTAVEYGIQLARHQCKTFTVYAAVCWYVDAWHHAYHEYLSPHSILDQPPACWIADTTWHYVHYMWWWCVMSGYVCRMGTWGSSSTNHTSTQLSRRP
jgi:hypothetical protein